MNGNVSLKFSGDHAASIFISRHQFAVFERFRAHDPRQCIPENMRVIAVVVSPFQFLEIFVHVLDAHLVERAHERTLEEAPDAFDAVCMNVSHDPFILGMSHGFMARIMVGDADIRPQFIRVNGFGFVFYVALDKIMERSALDIGNALDADFASALDGSRNPRLVALVGMALALHLATYKRFVDFYDSKERGAFKRLVSHRLPDSVAKIPSCFVGNAKRPLHLVGGNALFRFAHEVDSDKPLAQREVGIVHDGSSRNAELIAA